jgi:ABC-type amino acid transport substrate-binding protein
VDSAISGQPPPKDRLITIRLTEQLVKIREGEAGPNPEPLRPEETRLERIRRTGELRVGYVPDNPPFTNKIPMEVSGEEADRITGLDIDLIQRLAKELGVDLTLVPVESGAIGGGFELDWYDVAVGSIPSSLQHITRFVETEPYLELHAALLVEDHRVGDFRSLESTLALKDQRYAVIAGGVMKRSDRANIEGLEFRTVESVRTFFDAGPEEYDALLTTAEAGAIFTMIEPMYSVVVPEGFIRRVPIVIGVQDSPELRRMVSTWMGLAIHNGTVDELYEHWVLGKALQKKKAPRWSVVRNVFGWVK